jgi:hypothetical protein
MIIKQIKLYVFFYLLSFFNFNCYVIAHGRHVYKDPQQWRKRYYQLQKKREIKNKKPKEFKYANNFSEESEHSKSSEEKAQQTKSAVNSAANVKLHLPMEPDVDSIIYRINSLPDLPINPESNCRYNPFIPSNGSTIAFICEELSPENQTTGNEYRNKKKKKKKKKKQSTSRYELLGILVEGLEEDLDFFNNSGDSNSDSDSPRVIEQELCDKFSKLKAPKERIEENYSYTMDNRKKNNSILDDTPDLELKLPTPNMENSSSTDFLVRVNSVSLSPPVSTPSLPDIVENNFNTNLINFDEEIVILESNCPNDFEEISENPANPGHIRSDGRKPKRKGCRKK